MFVRKVTSSKHFIIIEDCDNVIFITTSVGKVMLAKNSEVAKSKLAKGVLKMRNFLELFFVDTWQM